MAKRPAAPSPILMPTHDDHGLCLRTGNLCESPIIAAYTGQWRKAASATKKFRSADAPNHTEQDLPKIPLLCEYCEQRIKIYEDKFKAAVWDPWCAKVRAAHGELPDDLTLPQEEWMRLFGFSVAWRAPRRSRVDSPAGPRPFETEGAGGMTIGCPRVPEGERRFVLEAREGARVVGRLTARRPIGPLVVVDAWEGTPEAARAAAASLRTWGATPGNEVLVVERPELEGVRDALREAGFDVARRKVFVERALDPPLPPGPAGLVRRSLAEVGERTFVARMLEASEGDPFQEPTSAGGAPRDPEREWRELVETAGDRFDPASWFLVEDDRGPVGVLLPQFVDDETGTLYYLGVVPARRGAGLGRGLHALGLALLAARGARRYVGSTDLRNAPMRRVFAANGCPSQSTEAYYRRTDVGGSDRTAG